MASEKLKKWLKAGDTTVSNVLLQYYRIIGLSNDQLVLILQLKSLMDSGNDFPDTEEIAKRMDSQSSAVFQGIHDLMQKQVLTIETEKNADGKTRDRYNFDLLWEKLILILDQNEKQKQEEVQQLDEKELFHRFESEFNRPLSPIEMQTVGMWIDEDHYPIELIEMALREAVLSQVYNLKYVDRILLNWERKNIRSKSQVEQESNRHRQHKNSAPAEKNEKKPDTKVPLHNWLNNNNNEK